EIMYGPPGHAYVYLCYGIHHLFNVVCNAPEIPHAVLIRGAIPLEGVSIMLQRTGKKSPGKNFLRGPGNFSKALRIYIFHTGVDMRQSDIITADGRFSLYEDKILFTPRRAVDQAGQDAKLPYRLTIQD